MVCAVGTSKVKVRMLGDMVNKCAHTMERQFEALVIKWAVLWLKVTWLKASVSSVVMMASGKWT